MPTVEQDPTDMRFVQEPYDFYRFVRSLGDFVYWKDYDLPVATTHAAVSEILRHPKLGRAAPDAERATAQDGLEHFAALEEHSLLELEAPDHSRIRRTTIRAFSSAPIALIAPTISQLADGLIDAFPEGEFDLVEAYAKPLAAMTITAFLGVSTAHADQLQAWSNDMVAMYQARRDAAIEAAADRAAAEFTDFIRNIIRTPAKTAGSQFLSDLIDHMNAGNLTEAEVISTAVLLLNAGHEATAHTLGNAAHVLDGFHARSEALKPEQIAGTVEECLRFRPPLHLFRRKIYETVDIEGTTFSAGSEVGCLLGSACHDDAVWPDAGIFDPFRPRRAHLAFGAGIHSCLGASLARLELQIALPVLYSRCPGLHVTQTPRVANLYHFHGFERLIVAVK